MREMSFQEYHLIEKKKREALEEFIDNLNVSSKTMFLGLTKDRIYGILNISDQDLESLFKELKGFRLQNGYYLKDMDFTDRGLILVETTIKDQEEFVRAIESLDLEGDKLLDLSKISKEDLKFLQTIEERRIVIYEDISPDFIDQVMEERELKLSKIFEIFSRLTFLEGYKVEDILIGTRGIQIESSLIEDEEEYRQLEKTYESLNKLLK